MRKDNFLNQRNSENRDKTAKDIKAGQVVQSRAGKTCSETGISRPCVLLVSDVVIQHHY